ncbi:MAG TPA: superoxide dismutase [Candidatus Bathyarchaeia archaeon]|nr:superoxide dismutase [Candidatus Bathyarchaeia archaeon]
MNYQTPNLPYPYDALEPWIDEATMRLHHDKHHAGYTAKLNAAIDRYPELFRRSPEELISNLLALPEEIRSIVRNNGGGHVNHALFWKIMGPGKGGQPDGDLTEAIRQAFGSSDAFKRQFSEAAVSLFGSGWVWLILDDQGRLEISQTRNQDSPLNADAAHHGIPVLNLDVWEHAYYLKYQNRRAEYVEAFWHVVDWESVDALHAAAKSKIARAAFLK